MNQSFRIGGLPLGMHQSDTKKGVREVPKNGDGTSTMQLYEVVQLEALVYTNSEGTPVAEITFPGKLIIRGLDGVHIQTMDSGSPNKKAISLNSDLNADGNLIVKTEYVPYAQRKPIIFRNQKRCRHR